MKVFHTFCIQKALSAVLAAFIFSIASAQTDSIPEANDRVTIHKTIVNGFTHPGIGLTKEMLDSAREMVLAKKEPWYSGYRKLCLNSYSAKKTKARNQSAKDPEKPDSDAFDSQGMEMRLNQDGNKAYNQALMYYFTGEDIYRENALAIIRVWSRIDPNKIKPYPDCHIHAGYPLKAMITAAEILRCTSTSDKKQTWTDQDEKLFTNNLVLPAVQVLMNQNGWFMNQNNFALIGSMSAFIYTNDREHYNERVEWFTMNKNAPNQGWSGSIKQLARLVDTNAKTGEKIANPQIQLAEMGRDQAHGAEDINLFVHLSRMMMAQGTKIDPAKGTPSTSSNAVGPFEFLDDRILAASDYFCRYMLGYDTPWIPVAFDIAPDGKTRAIYPRISDQYHGRMTTFNFWDLYFYYTYVRKINLQERTPFLYEAFFKRITPLEWLYVPKIAKGMDLEANPTNPDTIEFEARCTLLNKGSTVMKEGGTSYVRIAAKPEGTKVALLSCANKGKLFGLHIRTNGVTQLKMSGFSKPWLLPNTSGEWGYVSYQKAPLESFENIVFFSIEGSSGTSVDIDQFLPDIEKSVGSLAFKSGGEPQRLVTFVGAPVLLDFTATHSDASKKLLYNSIDKPRGAKLTADAGAFSWKPTSAGDCHFIVTATDGESVAAKKISIIVLPDRASATREIISEKKSDIVYVKATQDHFMSEQNEAANRLNTASDESFQEILNRLQQSASALEPLTPKLSDGSIDFTKVVVDSDLGESIALLADENDDTFPVNTLAKDRNYQFDFGSNFKFSAESFEIEGRLNFEDRAQGTAFFGSNDKKEWTRLTPKATEWSTDMVKAEVSPSLRKTTYRYLSIQKLGGGLFEPSELRIHGQRYETGN